MHLHPLPPAAIPAVSDPAALRPGDPPPTGGRLLLLYDGGCGICLHTRDLIARWDHGRHLAHDRIARHEHGLLADLDHDTAYASWHAIHPNGVRESGGAGLAAAVRQLPGGHVPARAMRRFPGTTERAYQWFARNRGWISRTAGLTAHPDRDPRPS